MTKNKNTTPEKQKKTPEFNDASKRTNSISDEMTNEHNRIVEKALIRHKKGDIHYANQTYQRVLKENPQHALALHYLGLVAQQTGHPNDAINLIKNSIKEDPTDPRAYNHLAQVFLYLKQPDKSMEYFKKALEIDPDHVDSLNNYANLLINNQKTDQAIALYRKVVKLNENVSHSPYNLAKALKKTRDYHEAILWYKKTILIDPNHIPAHLGLALIYEELGNFNTAIKEYHRVLKINPNYVKALSNILALKSYKPEKKIIAKTEQLLATTKLKTEDIAKLCHGLGKYYDRSQNYKLAFNNFRRSNEAQRSLEKPFRKDLVSRQVDNSIRFFNADFFAKFKSLGHISQKPVFIVGLPRSGTTVTEQILASHPKVFGAGELAEIPNIYFSMGPDFPDNIIKKTEQQILDLAQRYLDFINKICPQDTTYVTDKLPLNFMHIGLIKTLFPNAKIIYCRRNPLDVGLSCFIEMFKTDNDFSLQQEDFAHYFLEQERIRQHFTSLFPHSIFTLKYEDLVLDQENITKSLLHFCNIEWNEACMSFHETERLVNTPSRWQVRQPIYTSSINRWENYKEQLSPLRKILSNYKY